MPIIKIQPDSVRQQGSRLSQAASDLTALHWEINRLANQLDWEVRGKGHVEAKIGEAAALGKKLYEEAQRLSEYLKTCAAALEDADSQGQQGISATMSTASLSTGLLMGSGAVGAGVLAGVITGGRNATTSATNLSWHKQCISESKTFKEKMEEAAKQQEKEVQKLIDDQFKWKEICETKPVKPCAQGVYNGDTNNGFYRVDELNGKSYRHNGIDIQPNGSPNPEIVAAFGGRVIFSGNGSFEGKDQWYYGNYVITESFIDGKSCRIYYAHLANESLLQKAGDLIPAGTALGAMGNTGNVIGNPGTHLHMEIRSYNSSTGQYEAVDPIPVLKAHGAGY